MHTPAYKIQNEVTHLLLENFIKISSVRQPIRILINTFVTHQKQFLHPEWNFRKNPSEGILLYLILNNYTGDVMVILVIFLDLKN